LSPFISQVHVYEVYIRLIIVLFNDYVIRFDLYTTKITNT